MSNPGLAEWIPKPMRIGGAVSKIRVYEVGPRDGLQAEQGVVPTEVKIEFCRRLIDAGVSTLEATSFVPPSWIPQLADAEGVLVGLDVPDDARLVAFVPNLPGFSRAVKSGVREVSTIASATESFAAANLNTSVEGSIDRVKEIVAAGAASGIPVRGYLSMCFGDPWEGHVDPARVAAISVRLYEAGCGTIALSDTIGVGTPNHVLRVIEACVAAGTPAEALALHLHDTYGQALANVRTALEAGVREFDSSAGGLGRCPFAPGAAGNLATEDLIWMLDGMGIDTGINLEELIRTSIWMGSRLGRPTPSRVTAAFAARADFH